MNPKHTSLVKLVVICQKSSVGCFYLMEFSILAHIIKVDLRSWM